MACAASQQGPQTCALQRSTHQRLQAEVVHLLLQPGHGPRDVQPLQEQQHGGGDGGVFGHLLPLRGGTDAVADAEGARKAALSVGAKQPVDEDAI